MAIEDESDRAFMEALFLDYQNLMYKEIFQILNNRWATEDVIQSTLVKLIDKIPLLRQQNRRQRINYIISASKNTAINYIRDSGESRSTQFDDCTEASDDVYSRISIEHRLIKDDELARLAQMWPELDERDRYLLEGYYILQIPMPELAKSLGIKPASVRMALTRARKNAYSLLTKEGVDANQ